ncbi:MAG: hypothetical protein AB7Q17_00195 [Phycisphaerae bacterium]
MTQLRSAGTRFQTRRITLVGAAALAATLFGCATAENVWREDGASMGVTWTTPTAADVVARFQPAPQVTRDGAPTVVRTEDGQVAHAPLYFEDPFEDKGAGRREYRIGWEDYLAMPYSFARYTANWLMLPVSAVATPPWTLIHSDGYVSRQALGFDHDAERAEQHTRMAEPVEPLRMETGKPPIVGGAPDGGAAPDAVESP